VIVMLNIIWCQIADTTPREPSKVGVERSVELIRHFLIARLQIFSTSFGVSQSST
jgi:hypothetical protein